jgi:hypothetical protein
MIRLAKFGGITLDRMCSRVFLTAELRTAAIPYRKIRIGISYRE